MPYALCPMPMSTSSFWERLYFWILPKVNLELFNLILEDFAREFKVGKDKHIILTIDQAGWHTSPQVRVPEGLHLEFMPSHSPELQPAERLWPLVNEPIANRSFQNLDELEEVLFQRCQALLKQPSLIKGIACFHWWPTTKAISFRCNRNWYHTRVWKMPKFPELLCGVRQDY